MTDAEFEVMNKRRHWLITKKHSIGTRLTAEEAAELATLQEKAAEWMNQVAPLPTDEQIKAAFGITPKESS